MWERAWLDHQPFIKRLKMADLFQRFESYDGYGVGGTASSLSSTNPFDLLEHSSAITESVVRSRPIERKAQEFPILKRQDTSKIRVPSNITHVAVSNDILTVAVLGNSLYRFDLRGHGSPEICEIKREEDIRVHKIFQDPQAQHLLVCLESKDTFYISRGGTKRPQPRPLPKFKNTLLESVAWNKIEQTETSTGPILVGTNQGQIYETIVEAQDSAVIPMQVLKKRPHFTLVYELMADAMGHAEPITGLHMEPFPESPNKYFILATTPCRIYEFVGNVSRGDPALFQDLFNFYADSVKVQFKEIPGNLKNSQLCVWPTSPSKFPKSFAWLTGAGVYHGMLGFGDHLPGESLTLEKNLIPYSVAMDTGEEEEKDYSQKDIATPIGLALTEFHCVLLFREKMVGICHLNNKKVFEEFFNVRRDGALYSMATDPVMGSIWIHQAKMRLMMYMPFKESRNVWRIYLDKNDFQLAQMYAEGHPEHQNTILVKQAEHYFDNGMYEDAAVVFSQSKLSFEEVTLKFLQAQKKEALKLFLQSKLQMQGGSNRTQQTMLTTWLIELYLNELGNLSDSGEKAKYQVLQRNFHTFLKTPGLTECLEENSRTIYDLMASHGAVEDITFFAELMKDYDRVISHHIQQDQYEEALSLLKSHAARAMDLSDKHQRRAQFDKIASLFYKFSPVLVKSLPRETVDAWITSGKYLEPKKLIPSLIQPSDQYVEEQNAAAILYLEYCYKERKSKESSVHTFLVASYANSCHPENHKKLLDYLSNESLQQFSQPPYDAQYALRLCLEKDMKEACVHIYRDMGLYDECVSLSLEVSVDLAQRMISDTPNIMRDKALQRRLQLKIAEHVIKEQRDIQKAMQFLKDCYMLKIEDILPFFSDVVTIDQFKDGICDSLQEYNRHIDDLRKEMEGATDSARNIRADIQDIKNKCVVIQSDQKCQVCDSRLLSQAFYMFPCRHAFHQECVITRVYELLPPSKKNLLDELLLQLRATPTGHTFTGHASKPSDDVKQRIDDLVASDCVLCGVTMIQSVSVPLVPLDNIDAILADWK